MSQSRFSIVLVGVSALLRRPLVSRLRPAVFAARGSGGFRRSALPSASELPLGELVLLPSVSEIATRRVGLRAHGFRFSARTASELPLGELVLPPSVSEIAARRVGLRAHDFRFSARTASGLPSSGWRFRSAGWPSGSPLPLFGMRRFGVALGELAFGLTASAFRHAPLRGCPRRVGLRAHDFRFSACTASGLPSASWFFCSAGWPSGSRLPLFGMRRFGVALGGLVLPPSVSAFATRRVGLRAHGFRFSVRTASGLPLGGLVLLPSASAFAARQVGASAGRVGLRAHCFRFSACTASEWPLGEFVLPPSASEIALGGLILPLGGLVFGLTASAFRHAPLRSGRWAGWPSDSPLPLFGTRRSAPPHRRSEDRRSTTTRHLFHFKTLIPTC